MDHCRTKVLLVFPLFSDQSFWSLKEVCDVWGARCTAPPLGLITLAAMLPAHWDVRLVNRNAEALTAADLAWADLVMTGGMIPQQRDTLEVMRLCREAGVPVCIGGPAVTSNPRFYEAAEFLVLGEAEGIIDRFIEAWEAGARTGRFEAEKFQADVTASPIPRFELLNFKHYLYIGVQFSRGCPFTCEFCDIIELYGRAPRTKTNAQMLAELDRLYALGFRGHIDFVDDNLIGNKKAIKRFLPELAAWQRERNYPFVLSTEASINLADDQQLLDMMRAANFFVVFVGIESPDEDTLISAQKKQNTRRSLAESVERIYAAGMFVTAGFIVGFDTESGSISRAMTNCVEVTNIPMSMVGLLTALPNTQLSRRLAREGRLHAEYDEEIAAAGDQCTAGLNFRPLRSRREILTDYRDVLHDVYEPAAFFGRVRRLADMLNRAPFGAKPDAIALLKLMKPLFRVMWKMTVQQPTLARHFWPALIYCARRNPRALQSLIINMATFLHLGQFSRHVIREIDRRIALLDSGQWSEPAMMAVPAVPAPPPRPVSALAAERAAPMAAQLQPAGVALQ
ncbi:MAG: B12-binding radical protein [Enterovirga sp.]|jgi:radical SAM superfamily enzyme YgiQ (UPF0313 family)|nr:B12-binding radical protein [Enterovirga sp.]